MRTPTPVGVSRLLGVFAGLFLFWTTSAGPAQAGKYRDQRRSTIRDIDRTVRGTPAASGQTAVLKGAYRRKGTDGERYMDTQIVLKPGSSLKIQEREHGAGTAGWTTVQTLPVSQSGLTKPQKGTLSSTLHRMFTRTHVSRKERRRQVAMESESPSQLGVLTNRLLKPGERWAGKVHVFSLGHLLSVITGRMFHRSLRVGELGELVGFTVGEEYWPIGERNGFPAYNKSPRDLLKHKMKDARAFLLAQYPELGEISVPNKFKSEADVWNWVSQQEKQYGSHLPVAQKSL